MRLATFWRRLLLPALCLSFGPEDDFGSTTVEYGAWDDGSTVSTSGDNAITVTSADGASSTWYSGITSQWKDLVSLGARAYFDNKGSKPTGTGPTGAPAAGAPALQSAPLAQLQKLMPVLMVVGIGLAIARLLK